MGEALDKPNANIGPDGLFNVALNWTLWRTLAVSDLADFGGLWRFLFLLI